MTHDVLHVLENMVERHLLDVERENPVVVFLSDKMRRLHPEIGEYLSSISHDHERDVLLSGDRYLIEA